MAAMITPEEMIKRIGHDGSEILWPNLPEPRCRRAFHLQECINAVQREFAVTPFELSGHLTPDGVSVFEINFSYPLLDAWTGVALGRGKMGFKCRHAVAFCAGEVYDPNGLKYDFKIKDCPYFEPETILRFDLIF